MSRHRTSSRWMLTGLVLLAASTVPPDSAAQRPEDIRQMEKFFREKRERREAILEERVRKHPDEVEAYLELGKLYGIDRRFEEAIGAYTRAASLDPQNDIAHFNLGLLYHREGRLDEAIDAFSKVVELTPRDLPSRINLAVAYREKRGRLLQEEIAALEQAVRIRPDYPEARYHLGIAYKAEGDRSGACRPWYEKARRALARYVEGSPTGRQVARASRQMRLLDVLLRQCPPAR